MSGQDKFKDRGPEDGLRGGKIAGVRDGVEGIVTETRPLQCAAASFQSVKKLLFSYFV